MTDGLNASTMEMPQVETGSPSVDAGANALQATPEYTFGTPEMGASPLSQEYIDGTTGDFTPDVRLGSSIDTQADALADLPDTDTSVESSLSDLYKQFDENPDSLSDADLDTLAEDENKKFAEKQNEVPTDNTGESAKTDNPASEETPATDTQADKPAETAIPEQVTSQQYEDLFDRYLNIYDNSKDPRLRNVDVNALNAGAYKDANDPNNRKAYAEISALLNNIEGGATPTNMQTDQSGVSGDKIKEPEVKSLDDLTVIASATGPTQRVETPLTSSAEQSGDQTNTMEQATATNVEPSSTTGIEDPYAGKKREEVEEELRKHNQREVEFGNIDQDEANRRTKEGLKDFDEKHPEEKSEYEKTTKGKLENLDNENEQIQQDLINNKISPIEAGKKLEKNNESRRKIIDELVNAREKNERKLTPYEEKVAQKGAEIKKLMAEILYAPKIGKSMEGALKKLKDEFDKLKKYQVTDSNANDDKTIENIDKRDKLANAISAQATHMARYAKIISTNVNEFKSANSELEELIGARSWGYNVVVQVGTGFVRGVNNIDVSVTAKNIAKTGKMPR